MPIYEKPPPAVPRMIKKLMEKYHGPLHEAGVTIECLFAIAKTNDEGEVLDVALKLHGYPCGAIVKINSYKDRVLGHADAQIIIDGERWKDWDEQYQEALLDHKLEHLELKKNKDGEQITDDLGRPKLRLKLHDHQFGWFDAVARRHGQWSVEVQQFSKFVDDNRQLYLFDAGGFAEVLANSKRGNGSERSATGQLAAAGV